MPTRKDKTNVAPIYREQMFIPASGATLMKQKARPKINGRPVASGAIEIVSPEFDLLTGARGLLNVIKPNKIYANIGKGSNITMFDGATTTNEAVKQGIKEARDYVRHPVIVETVERNKELAERISGKPARNMGWFTDGNKVPANTRAEVLQHYIDRPVHIQTSNDLPKGFLGDYSSANTRMRVKSGLSPYDTKRVVFHEGLHHSGYGNFEGGLYDLKAEKLFGIDDYLLGHEAAVNTAELGRMMGLELGQKYPGLQTFKDMITKYNVDGFDKKFIFDKAILNTPRDYKRFWDALTGKYFTTAGAVGTGAALTTNDKMKCGGRRKAQLGLDIREGGIAIPINKNMYYMQGRSHDEGGIEIGPNNKNGLEVEDGEIIKVDKDGVKVYSSVPFLRGASPAQLVMGGANPNKIFKAQEEYKDRNRINDDGTKYQTGGEKKTNSAIRTEADKKVPVYNRAIYSAIDATYGYPNWLAVPGLGVKSVYKSIANPDEMDYVVTDSVADAAWRKRLGLSYNKKFLPDNKDGSVRLPDNISLEIPTDTTMLKNRIADNKKLAESNAIMGDDWRLVEGMIKNDTKTLNALRKTYKTGEPVVINEYSHNSRQLAKDGQLIKGADKHKTPLSVLQNFTIQYNPKTNTMDYRDAYDFNEFEGFVPGKPFDIKGSVPLKKKFGGKDTRSRVLQRLKNKFDVRGVYGGGQFGGAGTGSIIYNTPEYVNDTITKRYLVPVQQTFNDAFRQARQSGLESFIFDNKVYNTKLGDNPNARKAGMRTQTVIVPIERKEIKRRKKEYGGMIFTINGNVKNGLMSIRPKAEWGKGKDESTWKSASDPENFVRGHFIYTPYGVLFSDGTSYITANDKHVWNASPDFMEAAIKYQTNKRPQYYAKTELPLFTPDDSVKRAGYRYGWSHNTNTREINGLEYTIPKISIAASPAPRKGSDNVASTRTNSKSSVVKTQPKETTTAKPNSRLYEDAPIGKVTPSRVSFAELAETDKTVKPVTSSTGGQTQPKLIGQYKPTTTEDWIGLGSNLGAHLISYFNTKSFLDKYPMPTKPLITPAVKLKTRFNINSPLTELGEASQGQLNIIGRNTQSSSTSRAAQQRVINQTQRGRNQLYAQKENVETQLINQDRLNRQSIINRNMAAYNDWLDKRFNNKVRLNNFRASLINDTLTGMAGGIGDMLSRIESRRNTNNTLRAIAAANPNVDARQIGGFDYYTDMYGRRYDRNGKLIKP